MNRFALAALLAAAACAPLPESEISNSRTGSRVQVRRAEVGVYTGDLNVRNNVAAARLDRTPEALWPLLGQAYADLGLEAGRVDAGAFVLDVVNQRLPRIADRPRSAFFDCGRGMGGRNADRFDVSLTLRSSLVPAEGGTELRVETHATARSREHGDAPIVCTSTGELEKLILAALQAPA